MLWCWYVLEAAQRGVDEDVTRFLNLSLDFLFIVDSITLRPGQTLTVSTFFGAADDILEVPVISRRILQEGFVAYKLMRSKEVMGQITQAIATRTSHRGWDNHVQQMSLDNALQGGVPIILGDDEADGMQNADEDARLKVFHVFSRTRGDLERDYDDFELRSTFFSQVGLGQDASHVGSEHEQRN